MKGTKKIVDIDEITAPCDDCEIGNSALTTQELNKSQNIKYHSGSFYIDLKKNVEYQHSTGLFTGCNTISSTPDIHKNVCSLKEEKHEHSEVKECSILFHILKCPLTHHAYFIGTVIFVVGSFFFYYEALEKIGCWLFAFACALFVYASTVLAIVTRKRFNVFFGYICYNIGSLFFLCGSIYAVYASNMLVTLSFIVGSVFYLVGSVGFFFSIEIKKIKTIQITIFYSYLANFLGGVLFTVGSLLFMDDNFYVSAVTLYVVGSIFFTSATVCDYINYINDSMKWK